MIAEFRLTDVKSAPAFFDQKKLGAINADYIRSLPTEEFVARAQQWLASRWSPLAPEIQERARTLADVYDMGSFLWLPEVAVVAKDWEKGLRTQPAFANILDGAMAAYAECAWDRKTLRDVTQALGESLGIPQLGKAQAPIRLAVTGRLVGPPLFESLEVLGRETTLARLRAARARIEEA